MGEHPLARARERGVPETVIRICHFPSFEPANIVRAWKLGNSYHLVRKQSDGKAGYPPVGTARVHERSMSSKEWEEFEALLADTELWRPRTWYSVGPGGEQVATLDGDSWLAEYVTRERHEASAQHEPLDEVWRALADWAGEWFKVFEAED